MILRIFLLALLGISRGFAGSLFFLQMSDPQFGMFSEDHGFEQETANFEFAIATANRLKPAFVVVTGDLVNKPGDAAQIAEYKRIVSKLDRSIPLYSVPGNHDVGNAPSAATLAAYRKSFGPDYYTFRARDLAGFNLAGFVLDGSLIKDPHNVPGEAARQEEWLRKELEKAKREGVRHRVIFIHQSFFLEKPDEPDQYFNIPAAARQRYLAMFHQLGVEHVYAGHYHRNATGRDAALEMLTTGPVGKPLGNDPSGFRIVSIRDGVFSSPYYGLGTMPAAVDDGAGIEINRLFGPETATGRYKHPASLTELVNGDLYLAWYGGDGEYAPGTAVYGSRWTKELSLWSAPVVLAQDPFYSVGNPVVWQAPDGTVWLWYVVRPGSTWSTSRIAMKVSKDGARTWSDAAMLTFEEGTMVRGKPIVLKNGDYLLPVWKETGFDPEVVGADTVSFFLRFDPRTKMWSESNRIHSRLGALQPAVAQIDDNYLIAYCRRGGGYGPRTDGFLIRTESHDGGKTWTEGAETKLPNPNAAVDFLKLRNGHLVLVYNDSMSERTPLTVAVSTDHDKTYAYRKNIAVGNFDYAYPYVIQTRDGKIHLVYTSHGRTVINHAVFDESAIR